MALTARQLNRATLARQLLLERRPIDVVDGVRRVVALQAQEPASPYLALWNRIDGFEAESLDEAFAARSIVKATLMRITLHAVAADEYPQFHTAMLRVLRASRLNDRRYTSTGLTVDEAEGALDRVVSFTSRPRSKDEIIEVLSDGAPAEPGLWWAVRSFAPLVHAPTGGPWSFGPRPLFEAAPTTAQRPDVESAIQFLIRRYLEGFGPATAQDIGQFALQRQAELGPALDAMADRLVVLEGPNGASLYDVPGGTIPPADTPAPVRLLGMWDSVLLAYRDRSRVIPDEFRAEVIRRNGDVLPTVLVDGSVSGVWRPSDEGIEVRVFRSIPHRAWEAVEVEAGRLAAFVAARDPATYRRYARWWDRLSHAEHRVVAR